MRRLILFVACLLPACGAPVPYTNIGAYEPGKQEAIVWWWESLGGSMPSDVHAVVVRL
jgi:hypothetical protein